MRRPGRADTGSAPLEAIIIFPAVLLLVMTIFQAAVYYHARDAAQNAANGGAVVGAIRDSTSNDATTEAQARIDRAGGSSLLQNTTITADRTQTQVTVTVEGQAMTFVPGLPPLTVSRTVTAPIERWTTP